MNQKTRKAKYNLAAAVLLILTALSGIPAILGTLDMVELGYSMEKAVPLLAAHGLAVAACAFAAAACLLRLKGIPALAAFCLPAVPALLRMLVYYANGFLRIETYYYRGESEYNFSVLCLLPFLLQFAAWLGLALQSAAAFTEYLVQYGEQIRKLWFLPGVLYAVSIPAALFTHLTAYWPYSTLIFSLDNLLAHLLSIAALFVATLWVAYPEGRPLDDLSAASVSAGDGYCGIVKFLLLSVFTLGIWYLIWVYRTTRYMNRVEGELPQRPGNQLLACMFVPFYGAFWTYKNARRLDRLSASYGLEDKLAVLCLALSALPFGLLSGAIMQDRINTIALINAGTVTPPAPVRAAVSAGGAPVSVEANPDQLPEL